LFRRSGFPAPFGPLHKHCANTMKYLFKLIINNSWTIITHNSDCFSTANIRLFFKTTAFGYIFTTAFGYIFTTAFGYVFTTAFGEMSYGSLHKLPLKGTFMIIIEYFH
jgi:hypothetical protein